MTFRDLALCLVWINSDEELRVEAQCASVFFIHMEGMVAQLSVRGTWDLEVERSSPGRYIQVVFLDKTLNSHSASLYPGV